MNQDNLSWEEVYQLWKTATFHLGRDFNIKVKKIEFPFTSSEFCIKGYDWIEISSYERRIQFITEKPTAFLLNAESLNKGTLHTLELLDEFKDNPEISAAIWLASFAEDIMAHYSNCYSFASARVLSQILLVAGLKIREKSYYWHHAMKKLQPEIFFSPDFVQKAPIHDLEFFVEMATLQATLTMSKYKAVYYESYDPSEVRECNEKTNK
ncbi:hypothetical protein [Streptococcus catagoni]|uniref:hypothetical protein n=1 Tax=Streptococcus catagoni TaxID=2654874 RepID=UPI00140D7A06|nr:hypothetical protein [Streptococcus catagoni]